MARSGAAWLGISILAAGVALSGCDRPGGAGAAGLGPKGADPGPSLQVKPGAVEPAQKPPLELTAEADGPADGHYILRADLPEELGAGVLPWDVRVEGPRHGLACASGRVLWIRLVGAEPPAGAVVVAIRDLREGSYRAGPQPAALQSVRVGVPNAPREAGLDGVELRRGFFEALAGQFERTSRGWPPRQDSFAAFAAGRARLLAGRAEDHLQPLPSRQARTELGEAMSLYTGMSSVHEALQADRGLLLRSPGREARTLPAAELTGVALAAHPWEEMLTKLGRKPSIEPLAARVPQDVLYAHFNDVRTFVQLVGEIDELGTPLAQIFENQPGDQGIGARYEEELMV
ncbi:MAG TPA: hypothetical protein P5076_14845, partial [Myxococcota bacterium]|nr:hypothetical protein [Myxococcota bacterium]